MTCVLGKPFLLYHTPEIAGRHNQLKEVSRVETEVCMELCQEKDYPCDQDVFDLCCDLMIENNLETPSDPDAGVQLYCARRESILLLLQL